MDRVIKPCPFCEGVGHLEIGYDYKLSHRAFVRVVCTGCRAEGRKAYCETIDICHVPCTEAIASWNMRPDSKRDDYFEDL